MRTGKKLIWKLEAYDDETGELLNEEKYNIIGDPDRVNPYDSQDCANVETYTLEWDTYGYSCVNPAFQVTYALEWEEGINNYICSI